MNGLEDILKIINSFICIKKSRNECLLDLKKKLKECLVMELREKDYEIEHFGESTFFKYFFSIS